MRFAITFIFLLFLGINTFAQECKIHFNKAEEYLQKGKYDKALNSYAKARDCGDASYKTKSEAMIQVVTKMIEEKEAIEKFGNRKHDSYIIVPSIIYLPSGTEEQIVNVESSGDWGILGKSSIINVSKKNTKTLTIASISENTSTKPRKSSVTVECGEITRTIIVEQDGAPEILEYQSKFMNIPYEGGKFVVDLNTNTKWRVDYADWYKATPLNNDSTHMVIIIDKNTKNEDRNGTIVVCSEGGTSYDEMEIHQYANESRIFSPVDSIIQLKADRDTIYVPIISDNPSWTESDRPSWCTASKLNSDTLMIIVSANDNYIPREGFVNIKSNDRVTGIWILQEASDLPNYMTKKILGGKNISFGINASYYMPFVDASAGGDYVGSVLDYGLGTKAENASYQSAIGYRFGIFADIRLYKNFFLIAGINFSQIKYKNVFNKNTTITVPLSSYQHLKGDVQNAYTEDYTHNILEMPVLASYRVMVNNDSHIQLNLGPVLYFSLSSKMKISGNTNGSTLHLYNSNPPYGLIDNSNYDRHTAVNAEFNLHQSKVIWSEIYTLGNDAAVDHYDKFQEAPFSKYNCGLRFGVAYEWAGLSFGLSYTQMITNMANKNYWDNERWSILNVSDTTMKGYKHHLNTLEFKLAYTLRYK